MSRDRTSVSLLPGAPERRAPAAPAREDVRVCGPRRREVPVRVSRGRRLQAAGPGALHALLLGPDHWPQDELQGMEKSAATREIRFPPTLGGFGCLAGLSHQLLNIPHGANKPDLFLGVILFN